MLCLVKSSVNLSSVKYHFHFAHQRFDEVAGVPAKNNFKRWGAPAGGFDGLGKERSDHQMGRASLPRAWLALGFVMGNILGRGCLFPTGTLGLRYQS